jgi:hypothetical protein
MSRRIWIVGLSLVVLMALVALAASLHDVHFQPGRAISIRSETIAAVPPFNKW